MPIRVLIPRVRRQAESHPDIRYVRLSHLLDRIHHHRHQEHTSQQLLRTSLDDYYTPNQELVIYNEKLKSSSSPYAFYLFTLFAFIHYNHIYYNHVIICTGYLRYSAAIPYEIRIKRQLIGFFFNVFEKNPHY